MPTAEELIELTDGLIETLAEDLANPQTVEGDMGKVVEYDPLLKYQVIAKLKGNTSNGRRGVRFSKIVPPDANGM